MTSFPKVKNCMTAVHVHCISAPLVYRLDDPILPEQRSLEHAKKAIGSNSIGVLVDLLCEQASWRSVQPDMLESQREELDEEEMEVQEAWCIWISCLLFAVLCVRCSVDKNPTCYLEVYRNAFAAAKARYAEENHSVYTAAYDKAPTGPSPPPSSP